MESLSEGIQKLVLETVDFVNDELENKVEGVLNAHTKTVKAAHAVEAFVNADESIERVAGAVVKLANQFGSAFKNLDKEDAAQIKETVRELVTGASETEIENLFDASLDEILAIRSLNEFVDGMTSAGGE